MRVLTGRVAVVTGAASGIGLATSRVLAREGMRVVLADLDPDGLNAAESALAATGAQVRAVVADVARLEDNERLASAAYSSFGSVDVLYLNAGVSPQATLLDADPAGWGLTVGVNLLGVVHGIKAFVPQMMEEGRDGVVLASTSGAGTDGTSYYTPAYSATKIAVLSIMESLYGQLRDRGSALAAGVVFPPLTATHLNGAPENMTSVEEHLRAGGVPASVVEPDEVAELVLDGVRRHRFYIRAGQNESAEFFGGKISPEFLAWNERIVSARAEQQLNDGRPDSYLW